MSLSTPGVEGTTGWRMRWLPALPSKARHPLVPVPIGAKQRRAGTREDSRRYHPAPIVECRQQWYFSRYRRQMRQTTIHCLPLDTPKHP